jgi:hypothetical protein
VEETMQEYESWLDIECPIAGERAVACSLFARLTVEHSFVEKESVTFWPKDGQATYFRVLNAVAEQQVHYVSVQVDAIDRHFRPAADGSRASFYLRFSTLRAKTEQDALAAVRLLVHQHGFELDPYGPKLIALEPLD